MKNEDDLVLDFNRRLELLNFIIYLYQRHNFGTLNYEFSETFKLRQHDKCFNLIAYEQNKLFISPRFDKIYKKGYLWVKKKGFFENYKQTFIALTNIGIICFSKVNEYAKTIIPIVGSDIVRIQEAGYSFMIIPLAMSSYIFTADNYNEKELWLDAIYEFKNDKKKLL